MFDREDLGQGHRVQHLLKFHSMANFLFDGNSNVCFVSCHLQDIYKTYTMQKSLTLKIKIKVKENKESHLTGNVRSYNGDFFQNFSYQATYVYTKKVTCTYTHSERQVSGLVTIDKICKADLPNNN